MLILGIDTSGREGSVALVRGDAEKTETLGVVLIAGGTYSAQLIPSIVSLLNTHGLSKTDLDGFAVASGPGSFTGLRVGLAGVKGLAEILHKPVASISVLEAVATTGNQGGEVISATDAARKEVFVGEYRAESEKMECVGESLMPQGDFLRLLDSRPSAHLVTPDFDLAEMARFHMHVVHVGRPKADDYARLGLARILAGNTVPPEVLEANYIRRSDAEIFSKPSF